MITAIKEAKTQGQESCNRKDGRDIEIPLHISNHCISQPETHAVKHQEERERERGDSSPVTTGNANHRGGGGQDEKVTLLVKKKTIFLFYKL